MPGRDIAVTFPLLLPEGCWSPSAGENLSEFAIKANAQELECLVLYLRVLYTYLWLVVRYRGIFSVYNFN
jgi:hypothetical protein